MAIAEATLQLRRTADYLRSMPLARLSRGTPSPADRGRSLAQEGAWLAAEMAPESGPPTGVELPVVGDHAVGDLLGMVANELERVADGLPAGTSAGSQSMAAQIVEDCIQLRRDA